MSIEHLLGNGIYTKMGRGRRGLCYMIGKKNLKNFFNPPAAMFLQEKRVKAASQPVILLTEEVIAQLRAFDKSFVANLLTGN